MVPLIWIQVIEEPSEPKNQTWGDIINYCLELRSIVQKHNMDKQKILEWQTQE